MRSRARLTWCSFVQACVKEALRVFGPVPMGLPRIAPKGGLTIGDRTIPEGTIVSINRELIVSLNVCGGSADFAISNYSVGDALLEGDMGRGCTCVQPRSVVGKGQRCQREVLDTCKSDTSSRTRRTRCYACRLTELRSSEQDTAVALGKTSQRSNSPRWQQHWSGTTRSNKWKRRRTGSGKLTSQSSRIHGPCTSRRGHRMS
jgi:hypothetical protein